MSHRVHFAWAGFELTTVVVIDTDCIASCKSNTTRSRRPKLILNIDSHVMILRVQDKKGKSLSVVEQQLIHMYTSIQNVIPVCSVLTFDYRWWYCGLLTVLCDYYSVFSSYFSFHSFFGVVGKYRSSSGDSFVSNDSEYCSVSSWYTGVW